MSTADYQHQAIASSPAQREAAARLLWTGAIFGFFLIQAVLWAVAITLTCQDPSHAVLEDYDQRALNWDSWQEAQKASAGLGWSSQLEISQTAQVDGDRDLILQLSGRAGEALTGATVSLRVFHRARAAEAQLIPLVEASPGIYIGDFQARYRGLWTIELTAMQGGRRFFDEYRMELDREQSTVLVYRNSPEPRRLK